MRHGEGRKEGNRGKGGRKEERAVKSTWRVPEVIGMPKYLFINASCKRRPEECGEDSFRINKSLIAEERHLMLPLGRPKINRRRA